MKTGDHNLRLLFLAEIFNKQTDENHVYSAIQLIEMLNDYGIKCERKSIYRDVDDLKEFGMDIVNVRAPHRGYYLRNRVFSVPEVRLLIDAVQAAKFISEKNSKSLIYKIGGLVSDYQQEELREQVYINGSFKTQNQDLYEIISVIDKAIKAKKQLKINYSRRIIENKYEVKDYVKTFIVNPYAMLWSSDHYYLICNNDKYSNLMHLRLDRIAEIKQTDTQAKHFSKVSPYTDKFDIADYSNKLFNMFSGEEDTIVLSCSNRILDEVIEKFGDKVPIKSDANDRFRIRATVEMSDGLVSWILQYGSDIKVVLPKSLSNAVKEKAKTIFEMYE